MSIQAMKKSTGPAWWVVILLIVFFWPVGIFLLYRKITSDKTAVLKKSKTLSVIGWIMACFGAMYIPIAATGSLTTEDGEPASIGFLIFLILFLLGGGIALIVISSRMKKKGLRYRRYISIIVNQRLFSISEISAVISTSREQVLTDLQAMIDLGFFENAFIDQSRDEIFIPSLQVADSYSDSSEYDMNDNYNESSQPNNRSAGYGSTPAQPRIVTCKNCGANNTLIPGALGECEYCGSPLS